MLYLCVQTNASRSLPLNPYKTFSETICVVLFSMLRDILQHQKGKHASETSITSTSAYVLIDVFQLNLV